MPVAVVSQGAFAPQVAQTGAFTSPDVVNGSASGIKVILNMTAAGSGSVVLKIQGKDPGSGTYVDLLTGAAVTTVSTNVYSLFPLAASTASTVNGELPVIWRVTCSGNGSATSYTVGWSTLA